MMDEDRTTSQDAYAMTEEKTEKQRGTRKHRTGTVLSNRQDKTIVVRVDRRTQHPLYKKTVIRAKKYYAHDPSNEAQVGDVVEIQETRPLSKMKRWCLVSIVQRAATASE